MWDCPAIVRKGGRRRLRSLELHYWTEAEGCLGAAALRTLLTDLLSQHYLTQSLSFAAKDKRR
eukprot:571649-Pleurochrysis_carterae.AAC.1